MRLSRGSECTIFSDLSRESLNPNVTKKGITMSRSSIASACSLLAILAGSVTASAASDTRPSAAVQSDKPSTQAPAFTPTTAASQSSSTKPTGGVQSKSVHHPLRMPSKSAETYYSAIWGVDSLRVKYTESGEIVRFSYRVVDAGKAMTLNDKKHEPSLIDPKAGVKLVVPTLEKVGQLRQSGTPEPGKVYWMAFSNKGRFVKPGDYVNVVIGNFHANGLVVE